MDTPKIKNVSLTICAMPVFLAMQCNAMVWAAEQGRHQSDAGSDKAVTGVRVDT